MKVGEISLMGMFEKVAAGLILKGIILIPVRRPVRAAIDYGHRLPIKLAVWPEVRRRIKSLKFHARRKGIRPGELARKMRYSSVRAYRRAAWETALIARENPTLGLD
jgi:hypothetical protein